MKFNWRRDRRNKCTIHFESFISPDPLPSGWSNLTYSWNFDDNGAATGTDTSSEVNPSYIYQSGGFHFVTLTVTAQNEVGDRCDSTYGPIRVGRTPRWCRQRGKEAIAEEISLNKRNDIKIYPNPTSNFLNIEIPKSMLGNYNYTIIDQSGKQIDKGKINSNLSKIDVNTYSAGKYILTLQNSKSVITGHFILRH